MLGWRTTVGVLAVRMVMFPPTLGVLSTLFPSRITLSRGASPA